jgi:acyl-CoA ligase (AMP-forming) (exosortase A-associated)
MLANALFPVLRGLSLIAPDPVPRPLDQLVGFGTPNHPALTTREGVLDYAELEAAVGRLARALLETGLQPGDRVASWLPKTVEACILPLATARAGLIHVPINPQLRHSQAAHILHDSGSSLLIAAEGRSSTLVEGDCPDGCALWGEEGARGARNSGDPMPPSSHDPDALCAILYTSGSTGHPKGVMLSHANLWLGAISVAHYLQLGPEDRTLCVLPLSFDYGQNQLLSTWAAGGCAVPLDYMTARDVIRAVERFDINTLAGVPPLWVQMVEADWPTQAASRLSRLTNSGGALSEILVRKLHQTFENADLYPMYGLTEAFRSTYLDPSLVATHPQSMGRAIPFAEILVVRADGEIAADDEPGELVHAGPLVAQGYWRDPGRTAERFRPAPAGSRSGGLAVWSGDTVRRDAEGLHYFVGRSDEMIKVSGNRISPTEIEDAAVASGATDEAVAIGVPDSRLGQSITLVARGNEGAETQLLAYFRAQLPSFMMPARILWASELPRNANGKLDRAALRLKVTS